MPNTLNFTMFYMAIDNLADDEQKAKWMPLIKNNIINGCYA